MSNAVKMLIAVIAAVLMLGVGGSWLYINVIKEDAPDALSFDDATNSTTTSTTTNTTKVADADSTTTTAEGLPTPATPQGVEGRWQIGAGTQVGYRVKEILFGQDTEGVGRTSSVTGDMTIDGTEVSTTKFTVDMTSVTSDEDRRDSAFRGDIMNVAEFPTATFELSQPIELGSIPDDGVEQNVTASGDLTLRGTTKPVELKLTAKRTGETIQVLGNFEIIFADWGIPNPSRGPVSTEDRGLLELLLVFERS